ncbi:hypothetical protein DRQ50_07385 [bacterium]|nr:MAG: hypothetical protein DRQ50_07385 [bacterium]
MSRLKKLTLVSMLPLLLLVSACSHGSDPVAPQGSEARVVPDHVDYLALQKSAPGFTYEVAVEGDISLAFGGTVTGMPASWPEQSGFFAYSILPDSIEPASLSDSNASSVHIRVLVPVYDSDFPNPDVAMPMILEPDGLTYRNGQDATVSLSYHPALRPSSADSGYLVFCIDGTTPGNVTTGTNSMDGDRPYECSTRILAAIPHHSRWATSKDEGD